MVKKIITLIFIALLCASFVSAGNIVDPSGNSIENSLKNLDRAEIQVKSTLMAGELVRNMEKFQEKHQDKLYDCESTCTIRLETSSGQRDTTMVQIKRQIQLLWMDIDAVVDYEIDSDGEIVSEDGNFGHWLYDFSFVKLKE